MKTSENYSEIHSDIHIEQKQGGIFPAFLAFARTVGSVAVLCDTHTRPYADEVVQMLESHDIPAKLYMLREERVIPDEISLTKVYASSAGAGYLLAVGSGTINDLAKAMSSQLKIKYGVLATAPSMDGYASSVAALVECGKKVSYVTHAPRDILLDFDILTAAPAELVSAGVGDMLGKYTALADWKLSSILTGERFDGEIALAVNKAVAACVQNIDDIAARSLAGIERLTEALLMSGFAMKQAGSSRPASGSEHHLSHYIEALFLAKQKVPPLHGHTVGLGTLASLSLYGFLAAHPDGRAPLEGAEFLLPPKQTAEALLNKVGAPVRFSQIGLTKDELFDALKYGHTMRTSYTVLTNLAERKLSEEAAEALTDELY